MNRDQVNTKALDELARSKKFLLRGMLPRANVVYVRRKECPDEFMVTSIKQWIKLDPNWFCPGGQFRIRLYVHTNKPGNFKTPRKRFLAKKS